MSKDISSLQLLLESNKHKFSMLEGQKSQLVGTLCSLENQVFELKTLDVSYQKLQKFFQAMGTDEQIKLQQWFEQVVTFGLKTVFGDNYRFVIIGPEVKNNEIAIGFKVIETIEDNDLERDPYEEMGGGVADVLSFLLQFLVVFLLRDRIQPILFLDEAFKHLAADYVDRMAELLRELVERTPVQIFLVTHQPAYAASADVVYRFSKPGMETLVEREA